MLVFVLLNYLRVSQLYSSFSSASMFATVAAAAVGRSTFDICLGDVAKLRPVTSAGYSAFWYSFVKGEI